MWTFVPRSTSTTDYVLGLSVGQVMEPTALAILRRERASDDRGNPVEYRFDCLGLERFAPGSSYPSIAEAVAAKLASSALAPSPGQNPPRLALEITGVGKSVVDFFIDAKLPVHPFVVTSTGGVEVIRASWVGRSGWAAAASWYRVPKADLVAIVLASLQAERLKIAPKLPLAPTLKRELHNFRSTPARADELSGRDGTDDDMIFATAAALWVGNRFVWDWSQPICY
jgi:hypothetical protein